MALRKFKLVAVIAIAFALAGCVHTKAPSDALSANGSVPDGWHRVDSQGISFSVPDSWERYEEIPGNTDARFMALWGEGFSSVKRGDELSSATLTAVRDDIAINSIDSGEDAIGATETFSASVPGALEVAGHADTDAGNGATDGFTLVVATESAKYTLYVNALDAEARPLFEKVVQSIKLD